MRNFTILVDMDEVLENLSDVWIDELNNRHGLHVSRDDITEWDMAKFFPSLSRNEVFAPLHEEAVWKRIEPLPYAQNVISGLKQEGHEVIVVTAAHPDTVKWKYDWLGRYFPEIRYRDIIFCARKQFVRGDFLIDDGPHNLFGGFYRPIMFSAPHNRGWEPKKPEEYACWRVEDWREAEKLIRKLAGMPRMDEI